MAEAKSKLPSAWIVFAAFVLLSAAIGGMIWQNARSWEAFYNHQAEQNAQAYRDTARIRAEASCSAIPKPKIRSCVYDAYHDARDGERQEYDLQAQLVTSVWTRAMGYTTVIGMIVGIIGIGLVYTTFEETRRANQIAKSNARTELRAYVSFDEWKWLHFRDPDDPGKVQRWAVRVTWRNNGSTPTRHLRLQVSKYLEAVDMPEDYPFDHIDPNPPSSRQIAAGGSLDSVDLNFTPAEVAAIRDQRLICYVWGWAAYRDVLEDSPEYVTRFSFRVNIWGDPFTLREGVSDFSHSSIPIPHRHNCSDEECDPASMPSMS